jgi:Flp pilus assembly pilin Flp
MVRRLTVRKPGGVLPRGSRLPKDRGASAVEYALMVAFLVMVMIGSVYALGGTFNDKFTLVVNWLSGTGSP